MKQELSEIIRAFAEEKLSETAFKIIEIENRPGSSKYVVYIDGEEPVSIDICIEVSRYVSRMVDEQLPEDSAAFTYEVSSPGADKPIRYAWQLKKHIGRHLQWEDEETKTHEAEITGISPEMNIEMLADLPAKGRKKAVERETIRVPFDKMIKPRIAIKFR